MTLSIARRSWKGLAALVAAVALGGVGYRPRASVPRHLLLITIDTLRHDRLGSYGNTLGLTPNLDHLAAESERYAAAYAVAPFTLASVTAILTGHHPESLGVVNNGCALADDVPTLATRLQAHDWHTAAVVSSYVLAPAAGLGRGFDVYDATYPQTEAHRQMPERVAPDTVDAALRALDGVAGDGRPVFLWVHFQDPHGPYTPGEERRARYLDAERHTAGGHRLLPVLADETGFGGIPHYQFEEGQHEAAYYRAGYDGEVSLVDDQIGRLLAGWARRLPLAESLVVVTADHGEGLGEDNYWFAHGARLTDALVRVPLLVHHPARPPGERRDIVSLLDLAPTILRSLGVPVPSELFGRDFLAPGAAEHESRVYLTTGSEARLRRTGIVAHGYTYVTWEEMQGTRERILPVWPGDGASAGAAQIAPTLRSELTTLRTAERPTPTTRLLTSADRLRLRALGYVAE